MAKPAAAMQFLTTRWWWILIMAQWRSVMLVKWIKSFLLSIQRFSQCWWKGFSWLRGWNKSPFLFPYIKKTEGGPECLSQTRLYILLSKQRVGSLISIFLRSTYSLVIIKLIHFTYLFIHYSWGVCECKLGISFQTRTKKYEKNGSVAI